MIIRNNKLIRKGYTGYAFFPFIVLREDLKTEERTIRHERIHIRQQLEMLVIPFYIVYFLFYLINIFRFKNIDKAYREIPFEKEAYDNDDIIGYLKVRPFWEWLKYFK